MATTEIGEVDHDVLLTKETHVDDKVECIDLRGEGEGGDGGCIAPSHACTRAEGGKGGMIKGGGKENVMEKGKGSTGKNDKGAGGGEATRRQVLERPVLKASDLYRLEGLLQHCVEAFGRGLKVDTVIEQLVWAHSDGPAEARTVATEYFVRNCGRIQVGFMFD